MNTNVTVAARTAVLDEAHIGDIRGAFGTIRHGDHGPRKAGSTGSRPCSPFWDPA